MDGTVAPGFEPVAEAFRSNFVRRGELGAACAAYHDGECVVDLWGGYRDADMTRVWKEDTLVLMFSATKGVAALAMAHAHSRGCFGFDDRVVRHWPEFGQNGKSDVTVRQLTSHRAGVAAPPTTLTPGLIRDRTELIASLERKAPDWTPGRRHGYHAWTLGWCEDELLRRTDPNGRTLSGYLQEEIAEPLGLEFYFGVPEDVAENRVAEIVPFGPLDLMTSIGQFPLRMILALVNPYSLTSRALNPFPIRTPAQLNDPPYRFLEIPSGVGIGSVRDVARLYGDVAGGAEALDLTPSTRAALSADAKPGPDVILKTDTAYHLGFWKPSASFAFGTPSAFGAPGAGGAFAFADPGRTLGFAYAPNRMGTHLRDDPREVALRRAVLHCL